MDRVAIYGLSDSLRVLCDFSSDHDQLLAIVAKYDPTSKTQREAAEPGQIHTPVPGPEFNNEATAAAKTNAAMLNQNRGQLTMAALLSIANHLEDIPGRKNLVWLTANVPSSVVAISSVLSRADIAV
jgi:hypothetical protein